MRPAMTLLRTADLRRGTANMLTQAQRRATREST